MTVVISLGDRTALHLLHSTLESLDHLSGGRQVVLAVAAADPIEIEAPGIEVVPVSSAETGQLRRAGLAAARGRQVVFVHAGDRIPAGALARMSRVLRRTRSDFIAGAHREIRPGSTVRPEWASAVHDRDRLATDLEGFPDAVMDLAVDGRLFRRRFLLDQFGGLPDDGTLPDGPTMLACYLRARSFDVLRAPTYDQVVDIDPSTLVRRFDTVHLERDLAEARTVWDGLKATDPPSIAAAWLVGFIDQTLGRLTVHAGIGGAEYRARLAAIASELRAAAGPEVLARARVDRRLRLWLSADARWDELEELLEWIRLNGEHPPTTVSDGRVVARLPFAMEWGLPDGLFEVDPRQARLDVCIEGVRWDVGTLEVRGWAHIKCIDLGDHAPTITAWFEHVDTGATVSATVGLVRRELANRWSVSRLHDYSPGGFVLTVPIEPLDEHDGRWRLYVRLTAGGVVRQGSADYFFRYGAGRRMPARDHVLPEPPRRLVPIVSDAVGFCLDIRPVRFRLDQMAVSRREIGATILTCDAGPAPSVVELKNDAGETVRAELDPTRTPCTFAIELPEQAPNTRWTLRVIDESRRRHPVDWPAESIHGDRIGSGPIRWQRTAHGAVSLIADPALVEADTVEVSAEELSLTVTPLGVDADELAALRLMSGPTSVQPSRLTAAGDGVRVVFPLRASRWGGPELALPSGTYRVELPARGLVVGPSDRLLMRFPVEASNGTHSYTLGRVPAEPELMLTLRAPLPDRCHGTYGQRRLTEWYQVSEFTPEAAVLFQCYRGEFATDSQLAIHEELRRRRSDLALRWAVRDYSVALPDCAEPLLIGSPEWYAAVGSSRYLCQNIDFDRFFRRRPYQHYLQTFHGYPFKSMGVSLWRAQGKSDWVIDQECRRRTEAWTSILVPDQACEALYRREYRYDGQILVTGYPRDDALLSGDPGPTRERVLAQLEIPSDRTVVLYAPTWRDTDATGAFTAQLFDELDLDELAARLGPEFALLLRGHNYVLRSGAHAAASVTDVTSYPEINDLILAADIAILDYSSLRFDWMLTRKPMIFFVPDLADYLSSRTVLGDYAQTAPGPMTATTQEVGDAVLEISRGVDRFADEREAARRTFHSLADGHAARRVVDAFFV